ncbi:glycosyltransferase family 4 protein [Streptomyces sp. 4503]|uniref:Glycosyltransferase family 4 protein n=1 Tax=Streptomyces niphimycinicus TaxID=2842201 RepID=A0ABS6CDW8_9ACTN|nr:glycosyltransferase family 4 protein [Streptomyces niphimycinicus]MBU3865119.1 glycosyltransferase family 4 protein [Streptomyces niphimycinicus]
MSGVRVRYVHRGYFPARAGAELMTQYLAASMSRLGWDAGVYAGPIDQDTARFMRATGVNVQPFPATPDDTDPADLVHAVDAYRPQDLAAGLRLARAWDVPFAVTPASAPEVWPDRAAVLDVCRRADAVFALSGAERDMLRSAGARGPTLHIVGQGPHLPGTPDPAGFRREHGIEGPMVLFLGRKMRSKGYVTLLEATRYIWQDHPRTSFVFMGPRWDEDCAQRFAEYADPRIVEIGLADEDAKHSALAACELVCVPSTVDLFPLVYVEAWACGKPVVASTFLGSEEVITPGRDGLLAQPAARPVAEAVSRLLARPAERRAMGRHGHDRVRRELGWDAVADRVHTVYRKLIAARNQTEKAR